MSAQSAQSDCGWAGSRIASYKRGCRCDPCKAAYSAYRKAARANGAAWVERDRARHAERLRERRAAGEKI